MIIRSTVLFAHIVGVLLLFIGFALEWLSVESLRRSSTAADAWTKVRAALPRVYGIALGLTLLAGIVLAARVGVHGFAWVRLSLGGLVLIGILGAMTRRRTPSHPFVRFSLLARTAVALAIVYLMIAKPETRTSLIVMSSALGIALAASLDARRASPVALEIGPNSVK